MERSNPAGTGPNARSAQHSGEDQATGGAERRRSPRRRALKSALIVFSAGRCSMTCHVLDTSETGALLMPSDVLLCPDQFVLKPLSGPARDCEVVWRKGTRIGVRYL
ncbi:MAG TPA: hypothetical protein VJ770_24665 [Stellaceae bacterium]|nr:hypothetical protein [Stellaceae bacterium]